MAPKNRTEGFTLIELLIFSAIFTIIMIAFLSILVSVTAVHSRQLGASEVNQQNQFLLQQIQYHIERASMVELEPDTPTSSIKLRMSAGAEDPTFIYASGTKAYIKQGDGAPQFLTSDKVLVSAMSFTKKNNAPSKDSVSVSLILTYNSENPKQRVSGGLQTAISRVSAATFDFNVVPSSGGYKLGVSGQTWATINDVINFSGSNVGIGLYPSSPNSRLQISGGNAYLDTPSSGIILKSAGGACLLLTAVGSPVTLGTSTIACP